MLFNEELLLNVHLVECRCYRKDQHSIATHVAQLGCEENSGGKLEHGKESDHIRPENEF